MCRSLCFLFSAIMIVSLAGCSGPAVVSSNTEGLDGQSSSLVRNDIQKMPTDQTLAAGTVIRASLERALSTENNAPGDTFTLTVVDAVKVDDHTVIPVGSTIKGVVAESVRSGRVKGRAHMTLKFTELVLPNGKAYPLQVATVSRMAPSTKKRDAMVIGGGAGLGTLIGAIAGGGKGAAIGAVAGGGAGTGAVLATRGKETGYSSGSTLSLRLNEPLKVRLG